MSDTYSTVAEWDDSTIAPTNPVRSPSSWAPLGQFEIEDSSTLEGQAKWQQVLGPRPGRKAWTISNVGANPCELSNQPLSAGTHGVTVAAGGEWSEEVEDEVWAFCDGGTFLDVSETYTPLSDTTVNNTTGTPGGDIPYIAPLLP